MPTRMVPLNVRKFREETPDTLINKSNRKDRPFTPRRTKYQGFSFREKLAFFNTGKYNQKVRLESLKVISRLKGSDFEKVQLALEDDVEVYCSCPDFRYRFSYMAWEFDYGTNKETRFPDHTNPNLNGSVCKHLTFLLENIESYTAPIVSDLELSRERGRKSVKRRESRQQKPVIQEETMGKKPLSMIERVVKGEDPARVFTDATRSSDIAIPAGSFELFRDGDQIDGNTEPPEFDMVATLTGGEESDEEEEDNQ